MFKKTWITIGLLGLISAVVYRVWLSFSSFAFGDAAFAFSETLKEYIYPSAWGIHGGPLLWKYPLLLVYGVIAQPGLGYNIVDKFTVLWPIIFVAPLGSFLLIKKITNSNFAAFIGGLVFAFNTYFLSIDTQGHELLTVAFSFAPFAILTFINLLETKKNLWTPVTVLLLFIVGSYDLRSLYILVGVLVLYAFFHQVFIEKTLQANIGINFRNVFLVFFFFGLLNIYWLLPVISLNSLTSNEYLIRQLFGGEFYSLQSALTLFYPFWTGKEPTWFYVQKIPFYFWLFPILAFIGLITAKEKKVYFFGILALLGIFLTKQEASPFSQIYSWLYLHIPGFSAFREASKFFFLTSLSYAVLISSFVVFIERRFNKKWLGYFVLTTLVLLPLLSSKPLLTGEIKTMFIPKQVPQDFVKIKNYVVKDTNYSRVLGLNLNQYYNFTTVNHPTLNTQYSLRNFWGSDIVSYDFIDNSQTEGRKIIDYLNSDEGRRLLNQSSVGYLPVFIEDKQTNQNIRRDLGENSSFFDKELSKIDYLKKVDIGLENIILFTNEESKPHIYTTLERESLRKDVDYKKVEFKMISQSEYHVRFNSKSPVYLNFTELYHPQWKIHAGEFRWYEAIFNKNYFLSEKNHFQTAARFNGYLIDNDACNKNECVLTIYFEPQSYLYLGLIVSFVTLIGVFVATIYLFKKRNEKN